VTTLKIFFSWLNESGVLPTDPAEAIIQRSVKAPLPNPLTDDEVSSLFSAARDLTKGEKSDARPHALLSILLHTGVKKGECVALRLGDLQLSDEVQASITVRYDDPKSLHKERRIAIPASCVSAIRQYRQQYKPQEFLFPWTPRNLEYVLRRLGKHAGLDKPLSFDRLRWTSALRDWRQGMEQEHLRRKLGLSMISWQEVSEKLERLAEPPR
jgi:integrase/recombinase XerD